MGSGLILFVIVGAWLAVLVPMGLRAHDDAAPSRSVERFNDAMRVLSRRSGRPADGTPGGDLLVAGADGAADGEADAAPGHPGAAGTGYDSYPVPGRLRGTALRALDAAGGARAALAERLPRRLPSLPSLPHRAARPVVPAPAADDGYDAAPTAAAGPARAAGRARAGRPGPSLAAVRRRRVLVALGLLAAAGLVAALVVPAALLLTVACAVLSAAFVVHCRRQARSRAAWLRNRAAVEAELSGRSAPRVAPAPYAAAPRRTSAAQHPATQRPAAQRPATQRPAAQRPAARTERVEHIFDAARSDEAPAAARTEQFFDLAAYERSTVAAPAARTAVRAALGAEWQPVPVPLPTYVGKPTAPARAARPSTLREQRQAHEAVLDDPGEQHREVVERKRAAAGW